MFVAGLPDVGGTGAECEQAFQLGVLVPVDRIDVDVQGQLSVSGSLLGLRMMVGCSPPNPMSAGPISMAPSSRSSST